MRRIFRFGLAAGAIGASVCGLGSSGLENRAQAMQAEEAVTKELTFVIAVDDEEVAEAEQKHAPKYWLGISLKPVEGDLAAYLGTTDGVLVSSVVPESPADKAGFIAGDVLLAVGEEKLAAPQDLFEQMNSVEAGEDGKVAPLKTSVLRKGEKIELEVTPAERPRETVIAVEGSGAVNEYGDSEVLMLDLHGKSPDEIEKIVKGGLRVFRFGQPIGGLERKEKGESQMQLHRSVDAKHLDIAIQSDGEGPAKITVKRDGEVREYSRDQMDDMPEDVRKMVDEMLAKKARVRVDARVLKNATSDDAKDAQGKAAQESDGDKQSKKSSQSRSRIAIVGPEGLDINIDALINGEAMNRELAEKYRAMAEQIADRARESAVWAEDAAVMPEGMKKLRAQVEELREEVKELRAQLKSKEPASKEPASKESASKESAEK